MPDLASCIKLLSEQGIEILAMLGYIPVMSDPVISAYKGRIFNQHGGGLDPARISPDGTRRDFGGRGMMGMATHAAMFYYGQEYMRVFERPAIYLEVSSHHVVPGEIDSGNLIETGSVKLTQSDTLGPWHDRVIAAEHALQISVLRTLGMTGSLPTVQRHKPLIPDKAVQLLTDARARAIREFPKG
jgi:folate-dependent phosphoribosylglycinamide formyltransferase PurN